MTDEKMKNEMKVLILPLKKKWYDMIASGEKKEEYRERTPYWHKRLCNLVWEDVNRCYQFKHFDAVTFTLGYPRKADMDRRMTFRIERIAVGGGKPEWGAEPYKSYFVIKLGERIK